MNKQLSPMNVEAVEKLARLTARDPGGLSNSEILFLRARQMYLTKDELARFKSVLEVKKESKVEEEETEDEISYKELQKKASKLGIEKVVGVSREELEEQISELEQ